MQPEYYNTLSRLYNQGKFKPSRPTSTRLNSTKLIAEKARQLKRLTFDCQRSIPMGRSSHSANSVQHQYHVNKTKLASRIEISNCTSSFSDNIEIDGHGHKSRIVETDGWRKIIPLIYETTIPNAINLKSSHDQNAANQMVNYEMKPKKIIQFDINLKPMGVKYISFSMQKTEVRHEDILSYEHEPVKWLHRRPRNLSAHPKLGAKSNSNMFTEESQKTNCISDKVDQFCRSVSAFD